MSVGSDLLAELSGSDTDCLIEPGVAVMWSLVECQCIAPVVMTHRMPIALEKTVAPGRYLVKATVTNELLPHSRQFTLKPHEILLGLLRCMSSDITSINRGC